MRKVPYPHPGEILLEEFLKPMGITQYRLAKEIGGPPRRLREIVAGAPAPVPAPLQISLGYEKIPIPPPKPPPQLPPL